jgi:hypothetical protein
MLVSLFAFDEAYPALQNWVESETQKPSALTKESFSTPSKSQSHK